MIVQRKEELLLRLLLPLFVGGADVQPDGAVLCQIAFFDGQISELAGHIRQLFGTVFVIGNQLLPVLVKPFQTDHIIQPVDGDQYVRIDLQADGTIGNQEKLPGAKQQDEQAGRHGSGGHEPPSEMPAGAGRF